MTKVTSQNFITTLKSYYTHTKFASQIAKIGILNKLSIQSTTSKIPSYTLKQINEEISSLVCKSLNAQDKSEVFNMLEDFKIALVLHHHPFMLDKNLSEQEKIDKCIELNVSIEDAQEFVTNFECNAKILKSVDDLKTLGLNETQANIIIQPLSQEKQNILQTLPQNKQSEYIEANRKIHIDIIKKDEKNLDINIQGTMSQSPYDLKEVIQIFAGELGQIIQSKEFNDITNVLLQLSQNYTLKIMGHSLGGCYADIFKRQLVKENPDLNNIPLIMDDPVLMNKDQEKQFEEINLADKHGLILTPHLASLPNSLTKNMVEHLGFCHNGVWLNFEVREHESNDNGIVLGDHHGRILNMFSHIIGISRLQQAFVN